MSLHQSCGPWWSQNLGTADETLATPPPSGLMLSLITVESLTSAERAFLGRTWKYVHYYTNKPYTHSNHQHFNTLGDTHPAVSVPGVGTMSHHPYHCQARLGSGVMRMPVNCTHTHNVYFSKTKHAPTYKQDGNGEKD